MRKKINLPVIDFAAEAVDKIESLVGKSIHNEFGGVLCIDTNNKIHLENVIKGGSEGIEKMPKECETTNNKIGTFHTHPKYDPDGELSVERISSGDYLSHESTKDFISCIGHASTKKLTCMIGNSSTRKTEEISTLLNLLFELGKAEMYWLSVQGKSRKRAEDEIRKEGHYDKINKYYNWLRVDLE